MDKTRKQVAELFGISVGTLYRWEREGKTPRPKKIKHNQELRYTDEVVAQIKQFVEAEEVPVYTVQPESTLQPSSGTAA